LVSDAAANTVGDEPAAAEELPAVLAAEWVEMAELLLALPEPLLPQPAARAASAATTIAGQARLADPRFARRHDTILAAY
jgi:hypothetical protein